MRDAIERKQVGKYTVKVVQDTDPESPRDWDNLGTMICWHSRYLLGDESRGKHTSQVYGTPNDFRRSDEYRNAAVILPLYLYDHSGITMSCAPFSCPWDSGQIGYIYVTKDKVRAEYSVKRISKKTLALVTKCLQQEVTTYDEFLTGQVYGYVVEDENGEHIDSCFGFYGGVAYAMSEGVDAAKHQIAEDAKIDAMLPDTASVNEHATQS